MVERAIELLASAGRVLHCDVAGCGQVATWRSNNQKPAETDLPLR